MENPRANNAEHLLAILLKTSGTVMGLAIFAVVMPRHWMAATHEWLGLGGFPDGPIVDYLARTLSAMYAFYGGLLWICSLDVRRFAAIITYSAVAGVVFAVAVFVIDVRIGMPPSWTACEAPIVLLLSLGVLALRHWASTESRR
jgi:hypothetical protein